jgi:hypothetical protein
MTLRPLLSLAVIAGVACGCQPAPKAAPPPPAVAAAPTPAPQMATMTCRDSQTGKEAECGAPNAVPVAVTTD